MKSKMTRRLPLTYSIWSASLFLSFSNRFIQVKEASSRYLLLETRRRWWREKI